jgi:hypothetical protein
MANDTVPYQMADGRMGLNIDTAKTLTAADNGLVQNVIADAITITLPATAVGLAFTVRNGGVKATGGATGTGSNGTVLVTVAPNAADQIAGNAITAADNKAWLNTKATSIVGDELSIVGDATVAVGWNATNVKGIWARQA